MVEAQILTGPGLRDALVAAQDRIRFLEAEIRAWREELPKDRNLTPAEVRLQHVDSDPDSRARAVQMAREDERERSERRDRAFWAERRRWLGP